MKTGKLLFLTFITVLSLLIVNKDKFNAEAIMESPLQTIALNDDNKEITEKNIEFNENNKNDAYILKYKNNSNRLETLDLNDIKITCEGEGPTKADDEEIVLNNLKFNATFSDKASGNKQKSIEVLENESVYVFINSEYVGDKYPTNEVKCDYSIALRSSQNN